MNNNLYTLKSRQQKIILLLFGRDIFNESPNGIHWRKQTLTLLLLIE